MFSSGELDFDDVGDICGEGILTDKNSSFGIRLGDGDGVLLREHRGKGKS